MTSMPVRIGATSVPGRRSLAAPPWVLDPEYPVLDPEAHQPHAYADDFAWARCEGGSCEDACGDRCTQSELAAPLRDVVMALRFALSAVQTQYETVQEASAHQLVAMEDLAQVLLETSRLQRAAEAVGVVATAGYARREEHDVEGMDTTVQSIRARGFVSEWAAVDIGQLLRLSSRTAGTRVHKAAGLASRLPESLTVVRDGDLEGWQVQRAADLLDELGVDDETARAVDEWIAPRLRTTDPTRILPLVRYALGRIRPDLLPQRAKEARPRRALEMWESEPGLTEITARMPTHLASAIWTAASALAREQVRENPELTMDQARLDAFVDLALSNVDVRTRVTLGVPVVTSAYTRTGDAPVELRDPEAPPPGDPDDEAPPSHSGEPESPATDARATAAAPVQAGAASVPEWAAHPRSAEGYVPPGCSSAERAWWLSGVHMSGVGYIPPDVIESLITTFGTTISTALIDSERGTLLSYIHEGYRPPRAMADLVRLRDGRCRFFGCTVPAMRCDLDHAEPFEHSQGSGGGSTCGANLAGLCRRHHRAKQRREWTYLLDPDTGATWWINSRTGSRRTTLPDLAMGSLDPPDQFEARRSRPAGSRPPEPDDRELVNRASPERLLAILLVDQTEISLDDNPFSVPVAVDPRSEQPQADASVPLPECVGDDHAVRIARLLDRARCSVEDLINPLPF